MRPGADAIGLRRQPPTIETMEPDEVVFARSSPWLPSVGRARGGLVLQIVGGADANHDPREFVIPVTEGDLAVLCADLPRHLALEAAMLPLCDDAGISGAISLPEAHDVVRAVLHGAPADVAGVLRDKRSVSVLVAHGADIRLLRQGRVLEALRSATVEADWSLVREYERDHSKEPGQRPGSSQM
jgi:hypothetical protein